MQAGGKQTGRRVRRAWLPMLVVMAVLTAACSAGEPAEVTAEGQQVDEEAPGSQPPPSPSPSPKPTTATTSATTTAAPATAPQPAAPPEAAPPRPAVGTVPPQGLGPGDRGPQVKALEDALAILMFGAHTLDDTYDQDTADSVVAFQKAAGLARTGRVTQDVADALASPTSHPPDPLVPGGGPTRVEIDLHRQLLMLYENDALFRVLPVSTGSGKRFCHGGRCRRAVTPTGSFRVGYRIPGWRKSPLGRMYKPVYYMVGIGVAIHGYHQVPPEPASHGCVRIPMTAAEWFPDHVPDGTPVYVLDGSTPPGPPPPEGTQT